MSKKVDNIIFLNFNAFSGRLSKEVLASPQIMLLTSSIKVTSGEKEIAQEYRKGYKIGNRVIRHSMVVVAN